jgi:hypothetical protein
MATWFRRPIMGKAPAGWRLSPLFNAIARAAKVRCRAAAQRGKAFRSIRGKIISILEAPKGSASDLIWTTAYFRGVVLAKRSYIQLEWCAQAVRTPLRKETQPDGRIRHWIWVSELNRYLRVVTLPDGQTVHNAFPDRSFKP